ncbi:MAG: hydrogenase maturation protease [Pseudonocardiaceae bacterium]
MAGIGNIFLGDDAFGVELARRLDTEQLPEGVQVGDYGIAGMHLAYDLVDMAPDTTILLDAIPRGAQPGTLYVLEIGRDDLPPADPATLDSHGMQPDAVLALLETLGGTVGRTLLVGCEPASTEEGIGLSAPVSAVMDQAVGLVWNLINKNGKDGERHEAPAVRTPRARDGLDGRDDARGSGTVPPDQRDVTTTAPHSRR